MSEYSEKLKDPRWQKKRLEIMERDKFTCQYCQHDDLTLTVHHKMYDKKLEPWEYPDNMLITLCESCHKTETEQREDTDKKLVKLLRIKFSAESIQSLTSAIENLPENENEYNAMSVITYSLFNEDMHALIITLTTTGLKHPNYLKLIRWRLSKIYDDLEKAVLERYNG
jgi:HNH endonuclease